MPTISLLPPPPSLTSPTTTITTTTNPLPPLLRTPTGLALLELQGSILTSSSSTFSSDSLQAAISLGRLIFPSEENDDDDGNPKWDGKHVQLLVGKHQRMMGEVRKLGKAMAVVKRRERREKKKGMEMEMEGEREDDGDEEGEVLEVEAIVRYKIVFRERPEPMGGGNGGVE